MRSAPSVVYPVGRCAFYARLLLFLGVLGLLNLWVWWQGQIAPLHAAEGSGAFLVGLGLWIAWAVFAWRSWWRSPEGQLQWDAQAAGEDDQARAGGWRWRSDAYRDGVSLRGVELVLDLQGLALLRLRNRDAASSWIWVERARSPARWNDLRRALRGTP